MWVGYGACFLRGVTVGDNAVIGTYAVVTGTSRADAVVGGVPARILRTAGGAAVAALGVSRVRPARVDLRHHAAPRPGGRGSHAAGSPSRARDRMAPVQEPTATGG